VPPEISYSVLHIKDWVEVLNGKVGCPATGFSGPFEKSPPEGAFLNLPNRGVFVT